MQENITTKTKLCMQLFLSFNIFDINANAYKYLTPAHWRRTGETGSSYTVCRGGKTCSRFGMQKCHSLITSIPVRANRLDTQERASPQLVPLLVPTLLCVHRTPPVRWGLTVNVTFLTSDVSTSARQSRWEEDDFPAPHVPPPAAWWQAAITHEPKESTIWIPSFLQTGTLLGRRPVNRWRLHLPGTAITQCTYRTRLVITHQHNDSVVPAHWDHRTWPGQST